MVEMEWSWVPHYGRSQVVVMGRLWAQLVEWVTARVGGGGGRLGMG